MSGGLLLLGLAAAVAVAGLVLWIYRRRELPVPGRGALAAVRIAALTLLVLLLVDPRLPAAATGGGRWVLLDASRSMATAGPEGTPWERAVARGRSLADGGARVLLVGGAEPTGFPENDAGAPLEPGLTTSRLTPALERTAESGARSVLLISDLRVEDAALARRTAARLGLSLEVEDVGSNLANVGLGELTLPRAVRSGDSIRGEATVFASAPDSAAPGVPDSVTVEVVEGMDAGGDGPVVASLRVPLPGPGLERRVELVLPPPADSGTVRYLVRVAGAGDAFADDDARIAHVSVDPVEGSVVLLSTAPDWEPRFLLPVLGRASGLRAVGYIRMDGGRWLVMEEGGAGRTAEEAEVRTATGSSELLVIQSAGDDPGWIPGAASASRRALVLPRAAGAVALAGLEAGLARAGEWYVAPGVPPSPLAGELGSAELEGLPPLGPLYPLVGDRPAGGTVPFLLQRGGSGSGEPGQAGMILVRGGSGRRAVALAPGFWRWAFRSDAGRTAYENLWSGVTGWLLAEETAGGTAGLRPVEPVVPRAAPIHWIAPGAADDSLSLRVSRGDSLVLDTAVAVPPDGGFTTPALPPGSYSFQGTWGGGDEGDPVVRSGRLDVEAWSGDLRPPRATDLEDAPEDGAEGAAPRPVAGRPLRTHPLPYLLVLALLCTEWVARRRKGLR